MTLHVSTASQLLLLLLLLLFHALIVFYPDAVWVSEIMAQQTQIVTVIK